MGLDMFLEKKRFIGGQYSHRNVQGSAKLIVHAGSEHEKMLEIPANEISYITSQVGYWRKANAIHNWFVQKVQDGRDECQESYVSHGQLDELKKLCETILEVRKTNPDNVVEVIKEKLPPTSGLFFGSTDIDEYFFQNLEHTVEVLSNLDEDCDYYYQSSW